MFLEENIANKTKIIDISTFSNEKDLSEQMNNFFAENEDTDICIFVIDRQKISKRIVNRLRQLIEEAINLNLKKLRSSKHVLLLIHFPGGWLRIKKDSYPTLFLNEWEFNYLDSIGTKNGDIMNLKGLLRKGAKCVDFQPKENDTEGDEGKKEIIEINENKNYFNTELVEEIFEESIVTGKNFQTLLLLLTFRTIIKQLSISYLLQMKQLNGTGK